MSYAYSVIGNSAAGCSAQVSISRGCEAVALVGETRNKTISEADGASSFHTRTQRVLSFQA